ncbi:MAG: sugar phosphate isomerase/epimerase [Lentisphaeria bacterium]|nr:sugar phosphate isomerase/epimerase [Lentisphaeria bacterium]
MKIHFTSTAFHQADWREKLDRCRARAEKYGWEFGVQLHNTAPVEVIEKLAAEGVPLSVHAPLRQDRFWNLAREEISDTLAAMDRNFADFERMGVHEVVFHAALMSDSCPEMFGHGKSFSECMKVIYRPELALYPGKCFNRDFTHEPEYLRRFELLKHNIRLVRERYSSFLICLENDFPAYSGMNMFFRDIIHLGTPLCFDTGHLWIATHQNGLDYQTEAETAARSGLVRMCHFHSSIYTSAIPADQWSDGHKRLTLVNPEMDLERVFRTLTGGGVDFFVLEISDADVEELEILKQWTETNRNNNPGANPI